MAATTGALRVALVHSEVGEQEEIRQQVKRARLDMERARMTAEDWRGHAQALVEGTRHLVPVVRTMGSLIVEDYSHYSTEATQM